MSEEHKEKHFNPKAHILTLLGNELIKNPVMAIYELVKNSYDADSKKVDVRFQNIDDVEKAVIIVEDNGIGMTSEIIEDVWLEPGSDFRKPINKETGEREIVKSAIFGRVPMGEKGVGRFAVHKLGSQIFLVTRPLIITYSKAKNEEGFYEIEKTDLADYEIQLYINWRDFSQSKHLSDVPIKWTIKKDLESFRFKDKSGTYIRLSGLKETWTKGMARELKGQIISMLSPKISENAFRINLHFENQWLIDFPSVTSILEEAPYKITALVDSNYDLTYEYVFSLKNNAEIGIREIKENSDYDKNIKGLIRPYLRSYLEKKEYVNEVTDALLAEFDNKELPFGGIYVEFYSFDLDTSSMRDYTSDAKLIKEILKMQAGIRVFKGDLRVYDYGEPNNDWLGLDLERVQNKDWFSNNQNIGYIYLDAEKSGGLIEKTNREGFIQNQTFDLFYIVIKYLMTEFKSARSKDRAKWLRFNKKDSNKHFEDRLSSFKSIIDNTDFSNEEKKKKLFEEAERLEEKYEEDKNTLLLPAGVGMTASVALHEIEKLVPRMQETVNSIPFNTELITEQVEELKQYTDGILSVLRKGGEKPINLEECLNIAFHNYKLKLKLRKVSYELSFDESIDNIKCDKRYFITMVMNIIDNSIYWLDTIYSDFKGIYVKTFRDQSATSILFVDNGPGFKDDISDLVRPFFSRRNDGIGIGLYLIDTIMMKYGKVDIISNHNKFLLKDLEVPEIYQGAGIIITFNKGQI